MRGMTPHHPEMLRPSHKVEGLQHDRKNPLFQKVGIVGKYGSFAGAQDDDSLVRLYCQEWLGVNGILSQFSGA